jgi:hypothetical protein
MSLKHQATRALAAGFAAAAFAAPSALANDLRSPDARDAAAAHEQPGRGVFTSPPQPPGWLSPDAADAAAAAADVRAPEAPTVVEVTPAEGFDWSSAGIGALAAIALGLIALAGAATANRRSHPAPH